MLFPGQATHALLLFQHTFQVVIMNLACMACCFVQAEQELYAQKHDRAGLVSLVVIDSVPK